MYFREQHNLAEQNGPDERYNVFGSYKAYYVPIMRGKERFYHGVILNAAIGNDLFVSKEETAGEELYEILMKNTRCRCLSGGGSQFFRMHCKKD